MLDDQVINQIGQRGKSNKTSHQQTVVVHLANGKIRNL
jgi:hypothetical protein